MSERVTSEQLDQLEAALEVMTPPPWDAEDVAGAGWRMKAAIGGSSADRMMVEFTLKGDAPVTLFVEPWMQFPSAYWQALQAANFDGIALLRNHARALVAAARETERLRVALTELHAIVTGESPSLLNEDSGGSGLLGVEIEELLAEPGEQR